MTSLLAEGPPSAPLITEKRENPDTDVVKAVRGHRGVDRDQDIINADKAMERLNKVLSEG